MPVAVIGGGVVGAAVTWALARRGVACTLLEGEDDLAAAASGTNSGILHTGFDSAPGDLETELILRSAALREPVLAALGVPVLRCGAVLRPRSREEARTVAMLAVRAHRNHVQVDVAGDKRRWDAAEATLSVPGEAVTDPVAYTRGLAAAAVAGGAEVRTGTRVAAIERAPGGGLVLGLAGGDRVACDVAVNCAGLHADDVARLAGDESFEIYPRKGEFFVFDPPEGRPLEHVLLPVPTKRTKGVLVFPTIDGKVVAGPTAHDQEDKHDWAVRPQARDEVMAKAAAMLPALAGAEPILAYAGLRPAGRDANYVIGPSRACPGLINAAAIRSTGLSASLGIGEHVAELVGRQGVALGHARDLPAAAAPATAEPWWRRAATRHAGARR